MLNKPKFWDQKNISIYAIFLLPFSFLIILKNFISSIIPKKKYKLKSICIGNIYLGGTGKTPLTIKLYNLLMKENIKVATAKKNYKQHRDEQVILKTNSDLITGANRQKIFIKAEQKKIELLLFDDGLQDSVVDYNLKFVCFNSDSFVGNNLIIPAGPLRENLSSIKKYDALFINGNKNYFNNIKIIRNFDKKIPIFKTFYKIKNLTSFKKTEKYFLFSGIGNPLSFKNLIKDNNLKICYEKVFPDHYEYKDNDFQKIIDKAKKMNSKIITTEKDYVKIPKYYKKKIDVVKIDLIINKQKDLVNFIKKKLYENY